MGLVAGSWILDTGCYCGFGGGEPFAEGGFEAGKDEVFPLAVGGRWLGGDFGVGQVFDLEDGVAEGSREIAKVFQVFWQGEVVAIVVQFWCREWEVEMVEAAEKLGEQQTGNSEDVPGVIEIFERFHSCFGPSENKESSELGN